MDLLDRRREAHRGRSCVPSCLTLHISFSEPQALVDLINKRRPMGVEVLQPVELERLMVGDASLAGDDHRREAYAQLYLDSPAGGWAGQVARGRAG